MIVCHRGYIQPDPLIHAESGELSHSKVRAIKFYKVQWSNHTEEEATWEREDYLRREFPDLFNTQT